MTRYVWNGDQFVDRKTGEPMLVPERMAMPYVLRDTHYKSPLSGREITSRSQRREEMKVHGVREVEPSEFQPVYYSKKWAEKQRGEHEHRPKPDLGDGEYKRLSRDELPERLRRSIEQ